MMVPARLLQAMLLLSLMIAAVTIGLAAREPWPDITLALYDGKVAAIVDGQPHRPVELVSGWQRVRIEPADIIRDSDMIEGAAGMHRFYQRQTIMAAMLRAPDARLVIAGQTVPISGPRGVLGLPFSFWSIMVTGMVGLAISAVVLAADPRSMANRLVGGTGLLFQLLTAGPAITHARGVAVDGDLYRSLALLNELGASFFGFAMVVLFCIYPRRIVSCRYLTAFAVLASMAMVAISVGRWLAWTTDAGDDPVGLLVHLYVATGGAQMIVAVAFVALSAAIGAQYRVTRRDPVARAALSWFGLSVLIGSGAFIALAIMPDLLGFAVLVDGTTAFALLLFIYVGLTLALLRYRLFEAKAWSFRILFAALATVLLWIVDAAMIYGLGLDKGPALGLSIFLVGLVYLPARAMIASLLLGRRALRETEIFAAAIEVAFATAATRTVRWRELMQRLFDPLEIRPSNERYETATIDDDGLTLLVAAPGDPQGLQLAYPARGKRLFSAGDRALVDQLVALCRQAAEALKSYDRGAADERRRMAQDLHDDIGARLLSGIHVAQGPVRILLQDALRDIRTLVSGLIGESAPMSRVIADIRHESALRLEAVGIALDWPIRHPDSLAVTLSYTHAKAVTSSIREAVSNTIRHAGATGVKIKVDIGQGLGRVDILDDGCGIAPGTPHGTGLCGIAARLEGIGGTMALREDGCGTRVTLSWPLDSAVVRPQEKDIVNVA